ncbi:MAG: SusC/RagA family TonB-linked outer membrane protein, partial [Bacteroidota bacterium]
KTTAIEIGGDFRFVNDRFRFDWTYYRSTTKNQILSLPIVQSTGYAQRVVNGGSVQSNGIEILLGITPIYRRNFRWDSRFNFSRNVSTIDELPNEAEQITLNYNRVYDNVNQTVWSIASEDSRVGDIWGTGYLKNEAGEFVISEEGRFIVDNTLKKLGNYNPDFILGWHNQIAIQQFSIGFSFDWRQGGEIVSRTQSLAGVAGQLIETVDRPESGIVAQGVVNQGTADNPVYVPNTTAISAEAYYRQFYDRNHEENNVLNASYLKLREFSVTYRFPKSIRALQWAEQLSVSIIGRNLFVVSDIKHFDPEQLAVQGNGFVSGVEDMSYATTRSWGFSLALDF